MNNQDPNNEINSYSEYICAGNLILLLYNINYIWIYIGCGTIKQISTDMKNILCDKCSGRIFYKKRTKNPTQYEAR